MEVEQEACVDGGAMDALDDRSYVAKDDGVGYESFQCTSHGPYAARIGWHAGCHDESQHRVGTLIVVEERGHASSGRVIVGEVLCVHCEA